METSCSMLWEFDGTSFWMLGPFYPMLKLLLTWFRNHPLIMHGQKWLQLYCLLRRFVSVPYLSISVHWIHLVHHAWVPCLEKCPINRWCQRWLETWFGADTRLASGSSWWSSKCRGVSIIYKHWRYEIRHLKRFQTGNDQWTIPERNLPREHRSSHCRASWSSPEEKVGQRVRAWRHDSFLACCAHGEYRANVISHELGFVSQANGYSCTEG